MEKIKQDSSNVNEVIMYITDKRNVFFALALESESFQLVGRFQEHLWLPASHSPWLLAHRSLLQGR
jgi:hypothetical protein